MGLLMGLLMRREMGLLMRREMGLLMGLLMGLALGASALAARAAWADPPECASLMPLYRDAAAQLAAAEAAFLREGCTEQSEGAECRSLGLSAREMLGAAQMLGAQLTSLRCDLSALSRPAEAPAPAPPTPCARMEVMRDKAAARLGELERQSLAQRCGERPHAPPCRALKEARAQPLALLRAAERDLARLSCDQPSPAPAPPPPASPAPPPSTRLPLGR